MTASSIQPLARGTRILVETWDLAIGAYQFNEPATIKAPYRGADGYYRVRFKRGGELGVHTSRFIICNSEGAL